MSIFKQTADESSKEKKLVRDAMVYNIWLAGLGAYAKSADEVNQLSGKGKSLFDELIERGRSVESNTKERVHTARSQTSVAIEERMHQMVQGFIGIDNERLDRVDDKIDQLTANIEALLVRQQEGKPAVKKTVAKEPAKKVAKTPATRGKKPGVARRKSAVSAEEKKETLSEKAVVANSEVKQETVVAKAVVADSIADKPKTDAKSAVVKTELAKTESINEKPEAVTTAGNQSVVTKPVEVN
jgi:poly(hydroxyalkanoate) granule associated protein phasin